MAAFLAMTPTGPVHGRIRPPGSKSLTNRALVCAALAEGESTLSGALDSEDVRVMVDALVALGIGIQAEWDSRTMTIRGCGGNIPAASAELYVNNSGTTARFLSALLALGRGRYRLDGNQRMRERPIQDLLDALAQVGAQATSERGTGAPPLMIEASGWTGEKLAVRGDVSSQFLSGLLMAAPRGVADRVVIEVEGQLVSVPYVDMTLAVMSQFGVDAETERDADGVPRSFTVPRRPYRGRRFEVEPDASAASYFLAAAAVTGGEVAIDGLSRESLQGDVRFVDALQEMGCEARWEANSITVVGRPLRGIEIDMNAVSDTVMTLASVALFADGPTTITGVAHIRHKETDRITAVATELRKLGAKVEEFPDGLRIIPASRRGARVDVYDDHRMAMSLAVVGLVTPGVEINDPGCVAKTYPRFFEDLGKLTGTAFDAT
ncbi:MAG: 3-phosphoshikimate 1-carboxyvinyltransferase [Planctomycetales bacterium]